LKLRFWGTRGSIPSPGISTVKYGGNTTCLELILDDGTLVIFDAGTGIRKLGNQIIQSNFNGTIHLFLTHSHWDHIQGFPFFRPAYSEKVKIKIFGCPPAFNKLKEILTNQMESSYFPVNFSQLKAKIEFQEIVNEYWLKNAQFSFIRNNHPGVAYGFKVTQYDKIVIFITDNELSPPRNSTNTSFEQFIDFCRDADLLVHDAHYLREEMVETAGYGHSSYEDAFDLGVKANVKYLIFFHHEPDRKDDEIAAILNNFRIKRDSLKISMKLDAAKEGLSYVI
jgi:phosphoribosyl 1,2-cyclic phosphodiesterase